jgi:hypothetical protein
VPGMEGRDTEPIPLKKTPVKLRPLNPPTFARDLYGLLPSRIVYLNGFGPRHSLCRDFCVA